MSKSIKNYTTSIDAEKSIAEISKILSENGARKVMIDYDRSGLAVGLSFRIFKDDNALGQGFLDFSLPCRWEAVYKILSESAGIATKHRTEEQAVRTSWRVIRDWVDAQMALVRIEMVDIMEVFMPYAVLKDGRTISEHILSGETKLLLE